MLKQLLDAISLSTYNGVVLASEVDDLLEDFAIIEEAYYMIDFLAIGKGI